MKTKKLISLLGLVASAALLLASCSDSQIAAINPVNAQVGGPNRTQVERLARPGINEALLFTNGFLNTLNAITPATEAFLLDPANAGTQAVIDATPLLTEARTVLGLVNGTGTASATTTAQVNAFLPDVMRIDTTNAVGIATTAYSFELNAAGSPVSGRKLTDDVVDITLSVLSLGTVTSDGVPYYRPGAGTGSMNQSIGHQRLNGQATDFGSATFPFLAPPN